jgi:hypothetical protein
MSNADLRNEPSDARRVLSPYVGAKQSCLSRILGRAIAPALVIFCFGFGLAFAFYGPFFLPLFPVPLMLIGLVAIWALPESPHAPTRLLEALFFTFFIALIVWPNYLAIALPGLPWITMIRLVGFPLVIVFLICLSLSREVRREAAQALGATPLLWKFVVAFAVLQALSIVVSKQPVGTLQRVVAQEINWTAIFFISAYVFAKPGRAERWAALLCLMAVPIVIIAFWEQAKSQLPWADHIPSFLKIDDESVQRILAGAHREEGGYRVQGTFSTPLGLAEFIALAAPFVLHFMMERYPLIVRLGAAASIPVLVQVVLLTDSRLGLVGCITAALFYLLLWALVLWRRRRPSLFGPAIVLGYPAVACATIAATMFVGRIRERIWGSGQYDDSTAARREMYNQGVPMVLSHPWGYGAGMGGETLGFRNAAGVLTIDTYYLAIGLEYGIAGIIIYYGLVLTATYDAVQSSLRDTIRDRDTSICLPIAVALLNFIIIKSVFSNDDNHPLIFMMMGMLAALVHRIRAHQPEGASIQKAETAADRRSILGAVVSRR